MLSLTLFSISLTHNKQLEKYNEMSRTKTYRWKSSQNHKKGELFGFYFYGKFIRIHEILDINDLLILTQQLIEISWNEWLSLNGPKVTKTKQYDLINYPLLDSKLLQMKTVDKKVIFKEQIQLVEVPTAKIMRRFINILNKEVEYDATLWQIIFCLTNYGNIYNIWKRRDKLLLNNGYYQNNVEHYPRKILYDYRIIAQKCGKWHEYTKEKFEIIGNKIIKYNGIKKDYLFLDSKLLKWEYYERSCMSSDFNTSNASCISFR
jgi:hypothetical protein